MKIIKSGFMRAWAGKPGGDNRVETGKYHVDKQGCWHEMWDISIPQGDGLVWILGEKPRGYK